MVLMKWHVTTGPWRVLPSTTSAIACHVWTLSVEARRNSFHEQCCVYKTTDVSSVSKRPTAYSLCCSRVQNCQCICGFLAHFMCLYVIIYLPLSCPVCVVVFVVKVNMNTVSTFHLGISEAVHFTFLSPESIESTGRTTECPSARGADFFVLTGLVAQNKNPHH